MVLLTIGQSSDVGDQSLSSAASFTFALLNIGPLLVMALVAGLLEFLVVSDRMATTIWAFSLVFFVPLWWLALGHLLYRRIYDLSGQNRWVRSHDRQGFHPFSRATCLSVLSYPTVLLVLFLTFEFCINAARTGEIDDRLVWMGVDLTGKCIGIASKALDAFQWLVLPSRMIHENPFWMQPGATIHYSLGDFVSAGAVSAVIWTAVFFIIVLPVRYFLFRTGPISRQGPGESESFTQRSQ